MFRKSILLTSILLLKGAFSSPIEDVKPSNRIAKRANPQIAAGFTQQEVQQIQDGFRDAMTLASYAVQAISGTPQGDIFPTWFNDLPKDRNLIKAVFMTIMGDPSDPTNPDPTGSAQLGNINIVPDYKDDKYNWCCTDPGTSACTREEYTDFPRIVICKTGLKHGGIDKGYSEVQAINCDFVESGGQRVTWRMDTMGSVLLHEYTHYYKLINPILEEDFEVEDDAWGPVESSKWEDNEVDPELNACNYEYYADQAYWTMKCGKSYGKPQAGDDKDPACQNSACKTPDPESTDPFSSDPDHGPGGR